MSQERVEHRTYCRLCISLCGVVVTTEGDEVVKVVGDKEHPVTKGYTCPKGRALGHFHHREDRLDEPQRRTHGGLETLEWDVLLDDLAERLGTIIEESGPDAVGMYLATASAFDGAGRRVAERLLRKLPSRSKYTTATVDTACKPLISGLMTGYPGLNPTLDTDGATLVVLIGTNPVVSHGHFNAFPMPAATLKKIKKDGELWVVDPRRTETAALASRHLATRPGTDYAVLAYLVRELLADGADQDYLERHATGVAELRDAVEPFDLATAADRAGVREQDLTDLLAAVRKHGKVAAQTGTGATMSAAANVTEWLVWALHVVTGSYDRPGGMWFNPGFLSCLDQRELPEVDVRAAPGPPSRPDLPTRWGEYPCAALADEIEAGNLRALLVVGGNPVTSMPDADRLVPALRGLDVLAVADVVRTDTTDLATHLLPCTGQLERADLPLYTDQYSPAVSSQLTEPVVAPSAQRRSMWWMFAQLAKRLGIDAMPSGLDPDTAADEDLLAVNANRGRSDFATMRAEPTGMVADHAVFGWVTEKLLPDGRWRLAPEELVAQLARLAEPARQVLIPRRQLRHLNSQLREGAGARGRERDPASVLMHPDDIAEAGLADGTDVVVRSASGALRGTVCADEDMRRGTVSIPHGYATPNVGRLTSGYLGADPLTGMVLQSGVPVSVTREE